MDFLDKLITGIKVYIMLAGMIVPAFIGFIYLMFGFVLGEKMKVPLTTAYRNYFYAGYVNHWEAWRIHIFLIICCIIIFLCIE